MNKLNPIPYGSLFFAPMEGITDEAFRKTILKLYPEWDYLACDFLRVPSAGKYPLKYIVRHFGKDLFQVDWIKEKTMFQILTSHKAYTQELLQDVSHLEIPWVDINLGCPSNTVCGNGGGSSLLKDILALRPLISTIRKNYSGRLTAKVRIGYDNTSSFEDLIKMLNDEGIEMITVHGRTREQMYKEPAQWSFIAKAVSISKVPIIGNGDVWELKDINRMLNETGCYGVMVARGALKAPWIAQDYRQGVILKNQNQRIKEFYTEYRQQLEAENITHRGLLKQGKSLSRFMFDILENGPAFRRQLLLSQTVPEFFKLIEEL